MLGISELFSTQLGRSIPLSEFDIYTLMFKRNKSHAIDLKHPLTYLQRTEIVEALMPNGECTHNVLKCRRNGILLDITLGQFLGTMSTYIFEDTDSYLSIFPGTVLSFHPTNDLAIAEQLSRDNATFRGMTSPDSVPAKFTKRVICSIREKKRYCYKCRGLASIGSKLMRCARCQKVDYCSRDCQVLDWKMHKNTCTPQKCSS